jgi:hypothetical protein
MKPEKPDPKFRAFALALLVRVGPLEGLTEQDALDQPEKIVDAVASRIDHLEETSKALEETSKAHYKLYVTALKLSGLKPETIARVVDEEG